MRQNRFFSVLLAALTAFLSSLTHAGLKLRGFGDLIGYQQSGIKNFRFAHPVIHEDLFKLAENFIKNDSIKFNQEKYSFLLKLFDKADIINVSDI